MANDMLVSEIEKFLDGPLVAWFSSCLDPSLNAEKLTYEEVIDAVLIHHVFLQMDLHCLESDVILPATDASLRARNLKQILSNIRLFYEEELNHTVIRFPNVSRLAQEPNLHVSEAQLLLKLLLGCAVICPKKEHFIEEAPKNTMTSCVT
ncbi:hypothetical protein TSAR_013186 [Trichomalopsis sarcophagae]|uniref:HOOK N-terminal domain-containing protein n=1 Tax=Trichomalopsis sarcophagae TaxID=543379 RepID=A0A232ERV2_9HYME|nr:hypothetical protein TSAR_013186 [Trichomalopsis sarcophagae]